MEGEEKWCLAGRAVPSFGNDRIEKTGSPESDKEAAREKRIEPEDRFEVSEFRDWFIMIINFNNNMRTLSSS